MDPRNIYGWKGGRHFTRPSYNNRGRAMASTSSSSSGSLSNNNSKKNGTSPYFFQGGPSPYFSRPGRNNGLPSNRGTRGRRPWFNRGNGSRGKAQKGRARSLFSGPSRSSVPSVQNLFDIKQKAERDELCKDFSEINKWTEIPGFDPTAGQIWIYPTNLPVRDYQWNIVKTALFHNTFICLPTGMGKTFIAAVVMCNFSRWYPEDKIVFMAPTKPLVNQQIEACLDTVGISQSDTVELTGKTPQKKRDELWKTKRIFFITPQTMQSDMKRDSFPADQIRCLVIDEAHKALGSYAYSVVIKSLVKVNKRFRVVALSATPGNDRDSVSKVMHNLLIEKMEIKFEDSPEILPYVHDKTVETVHVLLDEYLLSVFKKVVQIFHVYSDKIRKFGAMPKNCYTFTSAYQVIKARDTFLQYGTRFVGTAKEEVLRAYAVCISMAHALTRLKAYGLRVFYLFLSDVLQGNKKDPRVMAELSKNQDLQKMLADIKKELNITSGNSTFTFDDNATDYNDDDGDSINENSVDKAHYLSSHPKMKVLQEIVQSHFAKFEAQQVSTRIMIFSQYRSSVEEIGCFLKTLRPLVKPMIFIGQANSKSGPKCRGLRQEEQQKILKEFKKGNCNVLVSTSVGEEGLDIGDVDLIICFDASKSPTKLQQRMGRTGRKRDGKIIFLLTPGTEIESFNKNNAKKRRLDKKVLNPDVLRPSMFDVSPTMIPSGLSPECLKMDLLPTGDDTFDSGMHSNEDDDYFDDEDELDDFEVPIPKQRAKKYFESSPMCLESTTTKTSLNSVKPSVNESKKETMTTEERTRDRRLGNETKGIQQDRRLLLSKDSTCIATIDGGIHCSSSNPEGYEELKSEKTTDRGNKKLTDKDMKMYCDLFDVTLKDSPGEELLVAVPPPSYNINNSQDFDWKEEYNNLSASELSLSPLDLVRIKENVDMYYYCIDNSPLEAKTSFEAELMDVDTSTWSPGDTFDLDNTSFSTSKSSSNEVNSPTVANPIQQSCFEAPRINGDLNEYKNMCNKKDTIKCFFKLEIDTA